MADSKMALHGLRNEIERAGYYPDLVADAMAIAVGGETIASYLVQQETTFDGDEVRRHVTVLVLTPTRLVSGHTDDWVEPVGDQTTGVPGVLPKATTSTETVPLSRVHSVVISSVMADPAHYERGQLPLEVTLTLGWGAVRRVDVEPAACGDPGCEADHGYTGTTAADDLTLRISREAEGAEAVERVLRFAADVSAATAGSLR